MGPGFGTLRLAASLAVVISHAPWLAKGTFDPIYRLSGDQTLLGGMAVGGFFIISGFLVTQSLSRSRSLFDFAVKRMLRIIPALVFVVLVSALVVGPLFTEVDLRTYFTSRGFFAYFNNCILMTQLTLPGVFSDHLIPFVNGSLWSLHYEVLCYIGLAALFATGSLSRGWLVLCIGVVLLLVAGLATGEPRQFLDKELTLDLGPFGTLTVGATLRLLPYFLVGVLAYLWRFHIPFDWRICALAAVGCLAGLLFGLHDLLFPVCGGYLLIAFALTRHLEIPWLQQRDYSYGIYIYSFPIQQMLISMTPLASTSWGNLLLSLPLVLGAAAFSWHYIEKPALALKTRLPARSPSHRAGPLSG